MNIGLIGLEKAGKTTIFNALTGQAAEVGSYGGRNVEPNRAIVDVADSRVDRLSEMYAPKKTVYATIEVVDFAGLTADAATQGVFSGEAMGLIKASDALALVARNFSDAVVDETQGAADPRRDVEKVAGELVLGDLIVIERRLERIEGDLRRGKKTPALQGEQKVLSRLQEALSEGIPVSQVELTPEDQKLIAGFQFLSQKPLFVVLNSGEEQYGRNPGTVAELEKQYPVIEFSGSFEMELGALEDPEERQMFMQEAGIEESARERLTKFAYHALGYLSFFTVGPDEVRAWTIRRGENAVDAAGAIHSDLARGFIRAEVFTYDDLIELGSEKAIKEKGRLRVEGKTYIVSDGDILHVRFSV
ncbi:MAG: redox-regulated ATPase YchF [Spirochaetaceae bacterium]